MIEKNIVRLENVSYSYNDQIAIRNIYLNIKSGDFLGLIGPNGSGKSTLLKIILGLLIPQQGSVELFGVNIKKFKNWRKIGYVPQKSTLLMENFPINVYEMVGLSGANHKDIIRSLELVGLIDKQKKLVRDLSGGQQQRVFIAKALSTNPELIILDEPTIGVDIKAQEKFYGLLRNLNKNQNITLILVSHDIDVVAHEVNQIACINQSLICHGKPQDILKGDFMEKMYGKELKFIVHGH